MEYVLDISRIHVAAGGIGIGRRAFMEAFTYAKSRTAYGKKLIDIPLVAKNLLTMKTLHVAGVLSVFRSWQLIEEENRIRDVLTPLLKYRISVLTTWLVREAILVLGGNGIIGDFSILPRLLLDCMINESWEGTHNILGDHAIKAIRRSRVQDAFWKEIERCTERSTKFKELEAEVDFFNQQKSELIQMLDDINRWKKEIRQMNGSYWIQI